MSVEPCSFSHEAFNINIQRPQRRRRRRESFSGAHCMKVINIAVINDSLNLGLTSLEANP